MNRRLLLLCSATAFGLLVGVLLTEGALRVAGISYPRHSERDDYTGTIRRAGIEMWSTDEGHGTYVRFNSAGFRDEEWQAEKPPNTIRVAVLGDSYVEAGQVAHGERFTEVIERELEASSIVDGRRLEVMTFGVAGYGTAQELMCLRHHVWPYAPDIVVLAMTTGNDVRNNSKSLQRDDGRPYFVFADGELSLDDSFRRSPAHNPTWVKRALLTLTDWSRIAQVAHRFQRGLASRAQRRETLQQPNLQDVIGVEPGLDTWVYGEPTARAHREAWEITEEILTLMHREVTSRSARFLVVTLSNAIQVHPDKNAREAFKQRLGVNDLFYPERRIQAVSQREGFPFLPLAPLLRKYAEQHRAFVHGFGPTLGKGHWNEEGHREAGRYVADALKRMLAARAVRSSSAAEPRSQ